MSTWSDLLTKLVRGHDLDAADVSWAMDTILSGEATPVQVAGFMVSLRAKGETVAELTAMSQSMLDHATPISVDTDAVEGLFISK